MSSFLAGISKKDITMSRGELDSLKKFLGYNKNLFPGGAIHPLFTKVLVTKQGSNTMVLITADLHNTPRWLSDEVRKRVSCDLGIGLECISVCTSQTHSTPEAFSQEWEYSGRLIEIMVKASREAYNSLQSAQIGATKGNCYGISYNRFMRITEETPKTYYPHEKHLGGSIFVRNHMIGRTNGRPLDPEVGVIRIDRDDGKPIAVLYNFSAHPATCIEGEYMHGDYVGFASEKIEKDVSGITALFVQGSLGNANINNLFGTWQQARQSGEKLAEEVLRVLPDIVTKSEVESSVIAEPFQVTLMPYKIEKLEKIVREVEEYFDELERNPDSCWFGSGSDTINLPEHFTAQRRRYAAEAVLNWCRNRIEIMKGNKRADMPLKDNEPLVFQKLGEKQKDILDLSPLEMELQVFRWNNIALCLHQFEMYYETGLEIKRLSPLRYTFPVGNSNYLVSYVAPADEFQYGGYPAVTNPMYGGLNGMCAPENHDRIIEHFTTILKS